MENDEMTETLVSSATKEVRIGFDRPFVIIGERINPTGRKILAEEMARGDYSRVEADALAQVEAGAHMLDVNAGIPLADEPAILAEAVKLVQSVTDVPLSIDSSIVAALESGAVDDGKTAFKFLNAYEELLSATIECLSTRTKQSQNVMKKATKENPDDPESWETTPFAEFPEFANWSAAHPDWTLKDMKKDCKAVNDVSNNVVASMSTFLGPHKDKLAESGLLESAEDMVETATIMQDTYDMQYK